MQDNPRKPLIIRGARQVGKTFTIKKFAQDNFKDNWILFDFEKNRSLHKIFAEDLNIAAVISQLEIAANKKIIPDSTLLIFDEIQACPRALSALRYFYEEYPGLPVVAAGSLLDFALEEFSFPVGRVSFLEMNPMTFAEFLYAIGKDMLAELLFKPPEKLPDSVHDLLLKRLRDYMMVGGMPEAVSVFTTKGSMLDVFSTQGELVESYIGDFSKYASRVNRDCLEAVLRGVAASVGRQLKYTHLAEGHSLYSIKKAFQLLVRARVITPVYSASPSGLPLGAQSDASTFKAVMVDMGLMHHLCGLNASTALSGEDLLSIYNGALAEQFVGQELRITQGGALYYWSRNVRNSSAEVDYLTVVDGIIRPLEVKSCSEGRLKSLHLLLQTYTNCGKGLVFNQGVYGEMASQKIEFAPLYYVSTITGNKPETKNG